MQLRELNIYLLDNNIEMCCEWKKHFFGIDGVEIVCWDFIDFMKKFKVDCVVSPANAFGIMDGGYDLAITHWFGRELSERVREKIIEEYYGEQPVGTSMVVDTDCSGVKLIHTPTMRYPKKIVDPVIVYQCMRTCLMAAMGADVKSMVIPAFGAATGMVALDTVATMMYRAYLQLSDPPDEITWDYALKNDI